MLFIINNKLTNLTPIHPFLSSEDNTPALSDLINTNGGPLSLDVCDLPNMTALGKYIACQCSCFLRLAPSISLLLCVTLILVVGGATPGDRIKCHVHPFVFITSRCPTHPIPTRSHQPALAGKVKQNKKPGLGSQRRPVLSAASDQKSERWISAVRSRERRTLELDEAWETLI